MKDSLYIIMPAYNEEDSLPTVLDQWYPLVEAHPDSRLVCFNDGSKDQTWAVLQEYEKTHPKLIAFNNRNQGHGATIYEGYQYAVNSNVDYVFQTDSDGQTDPSEFALFWDAIHDTNEGGGFDAIIGHRFARKDGISRVIVTNVLRWTIKLTLHENIKDANAPYRLLTKSTLQKALKYIPEKHNLTNVVLSIVLFRIGAKVKFVPVSFKKRETGVNSINLRRIAKIGFRALNDFWKLNKSLPS